MSVIGAIVRIYTAFDRVLRKGLKTAKVHFLHNFLCIMESVAQDWVYQTRAPEKREY